MPQKSLLLQAVRDKARARRLSPRTERAYVACGRWGGCRISRGPDRGQAGAGRVELPGALAVKYPGASREWVRMSAHHSVHTRAEPWRPRRPESGGSARWSIATVAAISASVAFLGWRLARNRGSLQDKYRLGRTNTRALAPSVVFRTGIRRRYQWDAPKLHSFCSPSPSHQNFARKGLSTQRSGASSLVRRFGCGLP